MSNSDSNIRVIKASYLLQAKIGPGPLDATKVKDAQRIIDTNRVDFVPLGMEIIEDLRAILDKAAQQTDMNYNALREELTQPIMQLKGNASMFRYTLIGDLANIMLMFLESIAALDKGAIEIVEAHYQTLRAIILQKIEGTGGAQGIELENELKDACRRYYEKRDIPGSSLFSVRAS